MFTILVLTFDLSAGDARHLRQECHTSQRVRSGRHSNLTYILRADHEFYCSNTAPINHKVPADVKPHDHCFLYLELYVSISSHSLFYLQKVTVTEDCVVSLSFFFFVSASSTSSMKRAPGMLNHRWTWATASTGMRLTTNGHSSWASPSTTSPHTIIPVTHWR